MIKIPNTKAYACQDGQDTEIESYMLIVPGDDDNIIDIKNMDEPKILWALAALIESTIHLI